MSDEVPYNPQDELKHYGILRKSGRYKWGSGRDEYARSQDFYGMIETLKAKNPGMKEVEIAQAMGLSVADLRSTTTIAKEVQVYEQTRRAVELRAKGVSPKAIAEEMGIPQATVRLRLKNSEKLAKSTLTATADVIRKNVDKYEIVDVGKGVENRLGIADTKKKAALAVLNDEGYETYSLQVKNVSTNNFTNQLVMVPPGTGFAKARTMVDKIHTMGDHTEDLGLTFLGIHPPLNVSSSRVKVAFKEDGGTEQDGLIYVRRGVEDVSIGKNTYAQVRIAVDGTHFMKGVAVYKDDLPPGVDLVYHSNKSRAVGKLGAMKPMQKKPTGEIDEDNPFGAMIKRQIVGRDKNGVEKPTSAMNLLNEEGDWDDWRKSLPSQMLSKQPHSLIKSQLAETRDQVKTRMAEIDKITNPIVKQKALENLADQIDADAVELRAAALPRQRTQVLIPMPKMNKGEIYAPQFESGEKVVLVRFPHGGRFEIPEVTVNNNNRTAKKLLGNAKDAIGVHPAVAERLSGADFDGDTVLVIPNSNGRVKGVNSMGVQASRAFENGLSNFDPKRDYGDYKVIGTKVNRKGEVEEVGNFPLMKNTGLEMGKITNLITDMTIQAAQPDHIVRAVRHSMVVIDAEKHKLDYKSSERKNGIKQLVEMYQSVPGSSKKPGGATTLLSRATSEERNLPERKLRSAKNGGPIDPETGARVYEPTGKMRSVYDPKTQTYLPEKVPVTKGVKRLDLTDDAFTLVRDPSDPIERAYAEHANAMKGLANQARLKAVRIPTPPTNKAAKVVYKDELDKLVADLNAVRAQAPLDRRANVIAGATVKARRLEDPLLRTDRDRLKKVERQAKKAARARLGLKQPVIEITDRQWDAIQSGAVSASRLREILLHTDPKRIAELSMPRENTVVTPAIGARAKAMLAAGATTADVAAALGISASTLRGAALRGDL